MCADEYCALFSLSILIANLTYFLFSVDAIVFTALNHTLVKFARRSMRHFWLRSSRQVGVFERLADGVNSCNRAHHQQIAAGQIVLAAGIGGGPLGTGVVGKQIGWIDGIGRRRNCFAGNSLSRGG